MFPIVLKIQQHLLNAKSKLLTQSKITILVVRKMLNLLLIPLNTWIRKYCVNNNLFTFSLLSGCGQLTLTLTTTLSHCYLNHKKMLKIQTFQGSFKDIFFLPCSLSPPFTSSFTILSWAQTSQWCQPILYSGN